MSKECRCPQCERFRKHTEAVAGNSWRKLVEVSSKNIEDLMYAEEDLSEVLYTIKGESIPSIRTLLRGIYTWEKLHGNRSVASPLPRYTSEDVEELFKDVSYEIYETKCEAVEPTIHISPFNKENRLQRGDPLSDLWGLIRDKFSMSSSMSSEALYFLFLVHKDDVIQYTNKDELKDLVKWRLRIGK